MPFELETASLLELDEGREGSFIEEYSLGANLFGKNDDLPQASAEERELLQEQAAALRQSRDITEFTANMQRLMLPVLMQQAGFEGQFDEDGNLVGFESGDRPGQQQADALRDALTERSLAALKGELPTNPALLRELDEREQQLQRELTQDFGGISAGRSSTPGNERKLGFERFRAETLENARRNDIRDLVPQAQSSIAQSQDQTTQFLNRALTVGSSVTGQGFNQVASGFGSAASNLAQDRQFLTQIQEQRRQQAQQNAGTAIGAGAAIFASDRRIKENIKEIGKLDNGLPVYMFNYIGNPKMQMSVMAQDVQKVMPDAVEDINGILHVNMEKVSARI